MNAKIIDDKIMKPKLLLHICCAPDEAYAVSILKDEYDLRCFFCNPNIEPHDEYVLRLNEAIKAAKIYDVPFVADDYDDCSNDEWKNATRDFINAPEGGARCRACFLLRLTRTAAHCKEIGFDDFATVMSVSPHKNVNTLNECGKIAAELHGVNYVPFDFKKKDGFKKSVVLSKELGLYRQNYCGCLVSKRV